MKTIIFIFCFSLITLRSDCQSLAGYWKGGYNYSSHIHSRTEYPINLLIEPLPDSTYIITSYTEAGVTPDGSSVMDVCSVLYDLVLPDSIYLVETKVIRSIFPGDVNFQKMALKINRRKKSIELSGSWWSVKSGDSGKIYFRKNKDD